MARFRFASFVLACGVLAACGGGGGGGSAPATGAGGEKKITIGFSMDTLKEERWQRDRDLFVAKAEELGARVLVQAANGDDALQNSQAENLLTQGVDVLLVAPHNGKTAAIIVESAHKAGVPVIAYDRLINDSDLDLYISFDNVGVGEMQANYLVERKPSGNYVLIGGAPTDNNALLFRKGQMNVIQPLVDKGAIKIISDQWAKDWQAVEALKIMENALTRSQQPGGRGGGQQRRRGGRRDPGPGRAEAGGQGARLRPGRRARGLPAHRRRHPEHDRVQADQAPRPQGGRGRDASWPASSPTARPPSPSTTARSTCPASFSCPSRWTRTTWPRP